MNYLFCAMYKLLNRSVDYSSIHFVQQFTGNGSYTECSESVKKCLSVMNDIRTVPATTFA